MIVSPKKVSLRKQKTKHEDVLEFEDDLREAQKDWKVFFGKYEEVMKVVVKVAKENGKVDFHAEMWQRTRLQVGCLCVLFCFGVVGLATKTGEPDFEKFIFS